MNKVIVIILLSILLYTFPDPTPSDSGIDIIQWNARSVIHKSAEIEAYINNSDPKPEIICIQESWLKPTHTFELDGYSTFRSDRTGGIQGGGILTLIRKNINCIEIEKSNNTFPEIEFLITDIKCKHDNFRIINLYNPLNDITLDSFSKFFNKFLTPNTILCGDFNAHSPVWGHSERNNRGLIIEDCIGRHDIVLLNDGSPTHFNTSTGKFSPLDLTFVSPRLALRASWQSSLVNLGSDHSLIHISVDIDPTLQPNTNKNWVYKKANWVKFTDLCHENMTDNLASDNIDTFYEKISNTILKNAKESIPVTNSKPTQRKKKVPWWNEKCQQSRDERDNLFRKMNAKREHNDCLKYSKLKAQARRTINNQKESYWKQFCTNLTRRTGLKTIWNTIRKMSGIYKNNTVGPIENKNQQIWENKEKADEFAKHFSQKSSKENYSDKFKEHKEKFEKEHKSYIEDPGQNLGPINEPFKLWELKNAIKSTKNSSPGQDNISYRIIKQIPSLGLIIILNLFNQIWTSGTFPKAWLHSIVVPILKNNKNPLQMSSFRPISLSPCLSKIMERMISNRLVWYLEKGGKINNLQSAYRKYRSVIDHILRLQDSIYKAINNNRVVIAIFLDIEKAFDMVWHFGLLYKLKSLGIKGNIYSWIKNYLSNRFFKVKIGNSFSNNYPSQNGTPQGSCISPILFLIMINDLAIQETNTHSSFFADDCAFWAEGTNQNQLEKKMQRVLFELQTWGDLWGFKFSSLKTLAMVFKKIFVKEPITKLFLDGVLLETVKVTTFLGIIFDRNLSWKHHIEKLITNCTNRLNILKSLSGSTWGCGKDVMLIFYKQYIRSLIDFGCEAYDSAPATYKKHLEQFQNKALRICCGALFSTPGDIVRAETGELSLQERRIILMKKYRSKLEVYPEHPTAATLRESWHDAYSKKTYYETFRTKSNSTLFTQLSKTLFSISQIPPWHLPEPHVDLELHDKFTKDDLPSLCRTVSLEKISTQYNAALQIYTDGSKSDSAVGCGIFISDFKLTHKYRLPPNVSIYTAELFAILKAIIWCDDIRPNNIAIFSDSLSALQSLSDMKSLSRPDILNEVLYLLYTLHRQGIQITFVWIPSHVGIMGNEIADKVAKQALQNEEIIEIGLGQSEVTSIFWKNTYDNRQREWSANTETKSQNYRNLHPKITNQIQIQLPNRRNDTNLFRLRSGYCILRDHTGKIFKEDINCIHCGVPETVDHYLLHCTAYNKPRNTLKKKIQELQLNFTKANILTNKAVFTLVTEYINSTRRFQKIDNG